MNQLEMGLNWLKVIGKDNLQSFQDNFAAAYEISICLFALSGEPLTVWSNEPLLCNYLRDTTESRCFFQHQRCFKMIQQTGKTVIETCYMGVTSFHCPVYHNQNIVADYWGGVINLESVSDEISDRFYVPKMSEKQFANITRLFESILKLTEYLAISEPKVVKPVSHPLMEKFNLTGREFEVVEQIIIGKSNKEIADILFISEKTVKCHVSKILRKMQVKDRTQIVLYCRDEKI